jgi:hypothetical protein
MINSNAQMLSLALKLQRRRTASFLGLLMTTLIIMLKMNDLFVNNLFPGGEPPFLCFSKEREQRKEPGNAPSAKASRAGNFRVFFLRKPYPN